MSVDPDPLTQPMHQVIPDKPGEEEGDVCNVDGCTGILQMQPVKNCSCHINPPCSRCVDAPIECPACHREIPT